MRNIIKKQILVLGAEDPEMLAIEMLARQHGWQVEHALDAAGKRVTPATAYQCQPVEGGIYVECAPKDQHADIDHHRPGDPGYGKPPAEFWQASSIGQFCAMLGLAAPLQQGIDCIECGQPTMEAAHEEWCANCGARYAPRHLRVVAAADHCLAAAYAGQCPGIDLAELAEYRIMQLCSASRASNRGESRTPEQVRASIEAAKVILAAAPLVSVGSGCSYPAVAANGTAKNTWVFYGQPAASVEVDVPYGVRDFFVADCRGEQIPDLPEAAMLLGVGYIAGGVSLRADDPAKIVIGGCGEGTMPGTAPVEAFLASARAGKVAGVQVRTDAPFAPYGDAARGFGGAYLF